jgi:hypothetical protein
MTMTAARARGALAGLVTLCAGLGLVPVTSLRVAPSAALTIMEVVQARATDAEPAPAGPLISLPFNELTGTIAGDVSGNGNTGTLLNGPVWTTGKSGGALSFDGTDDTLYVANPLSLNVATTSVTVSAWAYRSVDQPGMVSVLSRQVGTSYYEHFYLGFEDGKYRWFVNTTSGYSDLTLGGVAPLGQWVHLVGTYDGADVKLYVNGVLQFSTPHSGTLSGDITGLTIGASHNDAAHLPTDAFSGKVDEVNIYANALTGQEVLQLYQATGGTVTVPPPAPPPAPAPPATGGPIVHLAVDEGTGVSAADSSGNGNNGTLLNGPTWTTGKSGGALNFDGSNDTLVIGNSSTVNAAIASVTVAAWVYRNANQAGYRAVVSRELNSTYYEHYYLGFEDGQYRWFVNTTSGYSNLALGGAAPVGQWVHLVGTYDGATVSLYANGVLEFSTPHSGTFATDTTGITIGASYNDASHVPSEGLNGKVDEVNIYAYALTAQQVQQLYQATSGGAPAATTGPIVHLAVDEGTGASAADSSGNGNNGALQNGPTWTAGKSGGALNFDGNNDTLYVANSSTLNAPTTSLTVAAWVYRNVNQTGYASVVSRELNSTYSEHYYLGFSNGQYRWFVNTTSGYSDLTLGGTAAVGQWVHLVGTYDGATVSLYANGVLQFSTPHSGTLASDTTGITIGASHNDGSHVPSEGFNGKVDEVSIYASALTAQQVQQLYQATGGSSGSGTSFAFNLSTGGAKTVTRGSSVTNTITSTLASGTTQSVTYAVSGLPGGATSSVTPGSCSPDCSATVTIQTTGSTPLATSTVTVTGTSGSVVRTATFGLTVTATAAAGPIVHLAIDEGTGVSTADSSVNGNNGALLNGPTWTARNSGGALNFDGSNDTLYVANSSTLNAPTTSLTVAAWVYRNVNQAGYVSVVSRELNSTFQEHYYLGFEGGQYRWFVNTTSGYSNLALGGAAPVGQWVHLVGTYDGTTVNLYANGVLQFSTSHSGTLASDTTGITIGASHNDGSHVPSEGFNGKVDEVNIYAYALTAQQVQQLYESTAGSGVPQPDPASSGQPIAIAFSPSPDHDSAVSAYVVALHLEGQLEIVTPLALLNVGKPAVVSGAIQVDISTMMSALPSGSYYAIVTAIGPGGVSAGASSPVFTK